MPTCSEETSAHLKSLVVAEKIEMANRVVNKTFSLLRPQPSHFMYVETSSKLSVIVKQVPLAPLN